MDWDAVFWILIVCGMMTSCIVSDHDTSMLKKTCIEQHMDWKDDDCVKVKS
jgi:hypothetical protein